MVHTASQGWDTKASNKGEVKGSASRADPAALAKTGNQQYRQEQKAIAQRYAAISKAPPSPTSKQPARSEPASGVRGFFSRLFGK
jgi:hypothetical protein